jgi:acetolactate synthase-1/2/3 large subunit
MCVPGYWLAGFYTPAAPRKLQVPLGWGTLGYAFPASLGAALAGAGPVVAVCGDGGFLYACGELATVAQERIPLTAVIVDDGGYGMLRYDQARRARSLRRRPAHARLRGARAAFGVAAETSTGLDDAFGEALAQHVADATPVRARREDTHPAGPAAEHLAELVPEKVHGLARQRVAENRRRSAAGRRQTAAPRP